MFYNEDGDDMNNMGYTIKEMVILASVLLIFTIVGIVKVSYAYEDASNDSNVVEAVNKNLIEATNIYIKKHPDSFTENETFVYGKNLIDDNIILGTVGDDIGNRKIKVTKKDDKFIVELV